MKIKIARIKKGLTQAELRERVGGISPNTLVKVERGNVDNLKIWQAKKIAAVLDATVEELFFKEEVNE